MKLMILFSYSMLIFPYPEFNVRDDDGGDDGCNGDRSA